MENNLFSHLVRPHLLGFSPYSSARAEFKGQADVWLDANENPFDDHKGQGYNRYPDPQQRHLRQLFAQHYGLDPATVFTGNGSDEPIDLLVRLLCEPGQHSLLVQPPTYGMYAVAAALNNVSMQQVPLHPHTFEPDFEKLQAAITPATRLVFFCNPNNPTGNAIAPQAILDFAQNFNGITVVDEAYADFCPDMSVLPYIADYPRVVVLRTLSKAWGAAGLRLGFAVAHPQLIAWLDAIKPPYNISLAAANEAAAVLNQPERFHERVAELLANRNYLVQELAKHPLVVQVYPSQANFLLIQFKAGEAKRIYRHLADAGIIVRDRSSQLNCADCLRITVGTKAECEAVITSLSTL